MRKALLAVVAAGVAGTVSACGGGTASPSALTAPAAAGSTTSVASATPSAVVTPSTIVPADLSSSSASVSTPPPTPSARPSTTHPTTSAPKPTASKSSSGLSGSSSGSAGYGYSPTADAQAQIDAATASAKADGKEVLLDFGATWCGNCVAMDHLFGTSAVKATMAASYHLVQIDIGDNSSTNMGILSKYDDKGSYALPVLIVVSPSGSIRVDTNKTGNPGFDESGFEFFLTKWAV